jgi:hypothetical protein
METIGFHIYYQFFTLEWDQQLAEKINVVEVLTILDDDMIQEKIDGKRVSIQSV